jgi:hypothetical protein
MKKLFFFLLISKLSWSIEPNFEYHVTNKSQLVNEPKAFQEFSPVIIRFCLPSKGLILVQCFNEVGEASFPGEDIPQSPEIYVRHKGRLNEFGIRKPYLDGYCETVKSEWRQILETKSSKICFQASFMYKKNFSWWVWQLERLRSDQGSWSYFSPNPSR